MKRFEEYLSITTYNVFLIISMLNDIDKSKVDIIEARSEICI